MSHLLQLCNNHYDFSSLLSLTNCVAQDIMFSNIPGSKSFQLDTAPQSKLFFSCLEQVCAYLGWNTFFEEILDFVSFELVIPLSTSSEIRQANGNLDNHIAWICEKFNLFKATENHLFGSQFDLSPSPTTYFEDSDLSSTLQAP